MDEVFRERFRSFEAQPPEQVWERIKANIPNNSSGTLFSNPVSLATLAALFLIALIVGLYVIKQDNGITYNKSSASSFTKAKPDTQSNTPESVTNSSAGLDVNITTIIPQEIDNTGPTTSFGKTFQDEPEQNYRETINPLTLNVIDGSSLNIPHSSSQPILDNNNSFVYKVKYTSLNEKITYKFKPELLLGIYFNPEVMFYPDDNIPNQSAYHFDLTATLQYTDFFIESGVGLNLSRDEGGYTYNYQEYLGTYDDVYEVTFDTTENGVVPVYHTSPVDVYDSVKESYHSSKNRYTYLEIPVLFGFRKNIGKLSWFVKAGPAFSFLVHKNMPEAAFRERDLMLGISENKQPERVNSNVQLLLSAGINYRFHENFSLSCEPMFRYYITSAYKSDYIKSKHTYTAGLRVGLLYNF